jgi:ATP-dependent helicase IRC3
MISLGAHGMEAIAQPPTTFRLTPRPYQYEAGAALLAATARGVQRPLLVLPTGTGKTIVFALLVQRRRGRSLILAHRDELIQQAVDKLHLVDPTLPLGVVQATRDEHTAPTVVASVQTLSRRTRLTRLVPDFQTIVIDEAHHAPAPTYQRILDYCRVWRADGPLVVGVTATPERGDHHSLRQVFDRIVYKKTLLEMMQAGYLVDLRALQVLLQVDFDALRTQQGDFVEAELEHLLRAANAPAQVLAAFQGHAADRKALLFTPTVALAYAMAATFRAAGIAAEALDGTTPLATRRAILQRLHTGATRIVANCAVLTEGFDEPSVDCIIVARPTQSAPLYQQMLGRGTRTYPGKTDCLVLDVVGVSAYSTAKLPPLLGLWHPVRRWGTHRYLALFSPREGGADACTEVSHASSLRSVTAHMGPGAERSEDRPQPRHQSACGSGVGPSGTGGGCIVALTRIL